MRRKEERKRSRLRSELIDAFEARNAAAEDFFGFDRSALAAEIIHEEERALRSASPRVGRSRRTGGALRVWAREVLGNVTFMEVVSPFLERRRAERRRAEERYDEARERFKALLEVVRPEPGPEREWRVHRWTHEGRFGQESSEARDLARCDVAVARSMGIDARYEEQRGRYEPSHSRWAPQGVLVGAGFRVLAGVGHAVDLEILSMRVEAVMAEWLRRLNDVVNMPTRAPDRNEAFRAYQRERDAFLASGG